MCLLRWHVDERQKCSLTRGCRSPALFSCLQRDGCDGCNGHDDDVLLCPWERGCWEGRGRLAASGRHDSKYTVLCTFHTVSHWRGGIVSRLLSSTSSQPVAQCAQCSIVVRLAKIWLIAPSVLRHVQCWSHRWTLTRAHSVRTRHVHVLERVLDG